MGDYISFTDIILIPIYIMVFYVLTNNIKKKNIRKFPEYKYFVKGVFFKFFGVTAFSLLYLFYYGGGDTVNYFKGTKAIASLIFNEPKFGFQALFNFGVGSRWFQIYKFASTFPPFYMWRDPNTFSVCRFSTIFCILGSGRFLITGLLTSLFSFIGIWKLYRLFNDLYPGNTKALAYIILFLPSLLFWGGGIMKDSYILCTCCWSVYNFYKVFIIRKKIFLNLILFSFNIYIILNLKSYVLISLLPGMLIWMNNQLLKNISSPIFKILLFPIVVVSVSAVGFLFVNSLSESMGVYGDVDSAIVQAQVIQGDLLRNDQYGSNSYYIGQLDGTLSNLLSLAPIAIFTALFRPFIWEIGSPTMVISAVENVALILFVFLLLIRTNPIKIVKLLTKHPFLLFCILFSTFFAFGVGIAGTNFGALVRYKIPMMPFFFGSLYLIFKLSKEKA
jgi:hypothetical protein